MKTQHTFTAVTLAALVLLAASAHAQGRGSQGVPPGHLPPPGACRVWYDGRPAGHQPPSTSCREAEAIAARDWRARVIYGANARGGWYDGQWSRDDGRGRKGRAVPRRYPYPSDTRGYYNLDVAFENGYRDGLEKAREDLRDRDRYDPARHGRYRSGDHGYNKRYGPKDDYKDVYRQGFLQGYDDAYSRGYRSGSPGYGAGYPGYGSGYPRYRYP
jgi:hypothetical protein